jgi:hypothetical protein
VNNFYLTLDTESAEVLLLALKARLRVIDRFEPKNRSEYLHLARMKADVEAGMQAEPLPEKVGGRPEGSGF